MALKEQLLLPALLRLGPLFPFRWLKQASRLPVLPLYHAISEQPSPFVKHVGVWRSVEQFQADLDFLLKHYEPVSLNQLKEHKETKKTPLHLTFDDGLKECFEYVAPILEAKGIPATFFVNSAFVDNKALFFRYKASLLLERMKEEETIAESLHEWKQNQGTDTSGPSYLLNIRYHQSHLLDDLAEWLGIRFADELEAQPCYMSKEELAILQNKGFTIGAHSIDHPRYDALPLEEQLRQTLESLSYVQQHFSPECATFAFPFTDFQIRHTFFERLAESGLCDLSFGCAGLKKEIRSTHLQRVPLDENARSAQANLSKEYLYYLLKAPLGKNVFRRLD